MKQRRSKHGNDVNQSSWLQSLRLISLGALDDTKFVCLQLALK